MAICCQSTHYLRCIIILSLVCFLTNGCYSKFLPDLLPVLRLAAKNEVAMRWHWMHYLHLLRNTWLFECSFLTKNCYSIFLSNSLMIIVSAARIRWRQAVNQCIIYTYFPLGRNLSPFFFQLPHQRMLLKISLWLSSITKKWGDDKLSITVLSIYTPLCSHLISLFHFCFTINGSYSHYQVYIFSR